MKAIYRMIILVLSLMLLLDYIWDEMDYRTRHRMQRKMRRMKKNAYGMWDKMMIE